MTLDKKIIVLVGIMGAGKTKTGAILARLLGMPFIDSDQEIERIANHNVSEIFAKYGEAEFRRMEKKVMLRLLDDAPCVLASGGGAFIQDQIRKTIKQKAISVWLHADIDVLVERLSRNKRRPLLQGVDIRRKLEQLLAARAPLYAQADISIVTDDQTPQNSARLIKAELALWAAREKGNDV